MPSDDLETILTRARTHATVTMADTATLLGRSLNRLYGDARERGEVAGIPVIHVSEKSLRVPSRPLLRLVGLCDEEEEATDA